MLVKLTPGFHNIESLCYKTVPYKEKAYFSTAVSYRRKTYMKLSTACHQTPEDIFNLSLSGDSGHSIFFASDKVSVLFNFFSLLQNKLEYLILKAFFCQA